MDASGHCSRQEGLPGPTERQFGRTTTWIGGVLKLGEDTRERSSQRPWRGGEIMRVGVKDDGRDLVIDLVIFDV
jgi:hypothetical protein